MAYTKTNWVNGTTPINATNLNNIEDGIEDNETAINGLKGTVLWTNPNPNQTFTGQTITLSSSDYDILEIFYYDWSLDVSTGSRNMISQRFDKGKNTNLFCMFVYDSKTYGGTRQIDYLSDTSLTCHTGYSLFEDSAFTVHSANYWNVPVYVVGYKIGIN